MRRRHGISPLQPSPPPQDTPCRSSVSTRHALPGSSGRHPQVPSALSPARQRAHRQSMRLLVSVFCIPVLATLARPQVMHSTLSVISLAAALTLGPTIQLACALPLIWSLVALTGIDIDTQLLPDSITLPLLWAGLLVNMGAVFAPLDSAVIGAIAGYLTLWGVYWAFKITTGKEGMGYGDFKLLAALGAWFGWQSLPLIIILSSFVGAVIGIALMVLQRRGREVPMPFGPYLAGAGLLTLFFGERLTALYFNFVGL